MTPGKRGWTGAVIESYVDWVTEHGSHCNLFNDAIADAGGDPRLAFNKLYHSMGAVQRFGRTGKFDYLTMISKVGIASIIADQAYLREATGPLSGAKLLFGSLDPFSVNDVLDASSPEPAAADTKSPSGTYSPMRGPRKRRDFPTSSNLNLSILNSLDMRVF